MPEDLSNGQIAYQLLYRAIRTGQIKPGERLREADAAKLVGLSRTPVREAIRKLEADGIVDHLPRIGAVVKSLSQREIVELYEMRIVLEKSAAAMAAKHASNAEIQELEDLNAAMLQAAGDAQAVVRLNEQFHLCIFSAARNRYLLSSFKALSGALAVLGPTTLEGEQRIKTVCAQHKAIIDAIKSGDIAAASDASGAHLETSLGYRLHGLRK